MSTSYNRLYRASGILFSLIFVACNMGSVENTGVNGGKDNSDNYTGIPRKEMKHEDQVYYQSIHTPLCYRTGFDLQPPVIALNTQETVTISFDDFETNIKDLYYGLVHCDANWKPDNLMEQEFLEGFFTYNISSYKYGFNTYQPYIHYNFQLPNSYTKITRSGNYIVKVFANNDPTQLILTRRFVVYENQVDIRWQYKRPQDPEHRTTKQEIDFSILYGSLNVPDPINDLKVVLLQNNRWDNAIRNLKPMFVRDRELVYNLDEPNIFNGINEYRFFDLKSLNYNTPNVARILKDTIPYHVFLLNDERRPYKKYITSFDINGKFLIKSDLANDPHTESDYVWVHFYLPYDTPIDSGDIYLFGQFSDWQAKEEFKLRYNYRTKRYEHALYLKQGFYNYHYAIWNDKSKRIDETLVEGNHFDTENDYTILVYFYDIRANCDRLIGVRNLNSVKN